MKRFLFALFTITVMLFSVPCFSEPIISGVAGAVVNGDEITISGNGFGYPGPTILIYDNFEGGVDGANIYTGTGSATINKWDTIGGGDNNNKPIYSDDYTHSGSLAMRSIYDISTSGTNDSSCEAMVRNLYVTKFFATYWFYMPTTYYRSSNPAVMLPTHKPCCPQDWNWKPIWFYGESPGDDDAMINLLTYVDAIDCNDCYDDYKTFSYTYFSYGSWFRYSWYVDGQTTFTGESHLQYLSTDTNSKLQDLKRLVDWRQFKEEGDHFEKFLIGGWGRLAYNTDYSSVAFFDDVYVAVGDNARARVEIGDNAVYSECRNLSICTINSWTQTEIGAVVRQGSFSDSATAYVFVVNGNDGSVSSGYEVTLGEAEPPSSVNPAIIFRHFRR